MNYMLLIFDDEKAFASMPEARRRQLMQEYGEFTQGIVRSGHYRAGAQLQPVATATTLRGREREVVTTDGPFVETKEQLGGYYLLDCRDLDEALAIARRVPSLKVGGAVEVRPVAPTPTPTSMRSQPPT